MYFLGIYYITCDATVLIIYKTACSRICFQDVGILSRFYQTVLD